jgi:hypothetical protein
MELPARDSAIILLTLGIILGGCVGVWIILVRSLTTRRAALAMAQWAKNHEARFSEIASGELPSKFSVLADFHPKTRTVIDGRHWAIAELTTDAPAEAKGRTPRWRLLAWEVSPDAMAWNPTGLRPAAHAVSILDLLGLLSFPSLGGSERFVVFGKEATAAEALADSAAQTLLPPDIGLLLHGRTLLLDFSSRPFDPIQFERVVDLAQQLLLRVAPGRQVSANLWETAK